MTQPITHFIEIQRFYKQPLAVVAVVLMVLGFLFVAVSHWIFQKPVGNQPLSDLGIVCLGLFVGGLTVFFVSLRLTTKISEQGISFQLYPIHKKEHLLKWNHLESVVVQSYKPLRDVGGWGWRYSLSRRQKAYTIAGNWGIFIHLKDGRKLILGTQKNKTVQEILKPQATGNANTAM